RKRYLDPSDSRLIRNSIFPFSKVPSSKPFGAFDTIILFAFMPGRIHAEIVTALLMFNVELCGTVLKYLPRGSSILRAKPSLPFTQLTPDTSTIFALFLLPE